MQALAAQQGTDTAGRPKTFYDVTWGGLTASQGFGTSMALSFSGNAIASKRGSNVDNKLRKVGLFSPLDLRHYGGNSYYVMGHLLN
jgi:hypothetical protein